jgi:hypothetical protein
MLVRTTEGFAMSGPDVGFRCPCPTATVARKIAATMRALGLSRFDMKYSAGTLSHENMMRCISLYGGKVVPLVRDMVA